MIRRSVTLPADQDRFIERDRKRRGWSRSLWLQQLIRNHMQAAGFFVDSDMTNGRTIDDREKEEARS